MWSWTEGNMDKAGGHQDPVPSGKCPKRGLEAGCWHSPAGLSGGTGILLVCPWLLWWLLLPVPPPVLQLLQHSLELQLQGRISGSSTLLLLLGHLQEKTRKKSHETGWKKLLKDD